jgi:tetraacyldisaccharide 4'-kinase
VGGAGKTTVALDLAQRLVARQVAVHILLRGYGGSEHGPYRVQPDNPAHQVGDEALLLARIAPTWVGADRAATAHAAVANGAKVLLLDDGLQNPTLVKDLSLLVVDGETGFGNGRVLPAGPLREPVLAGAARCQAAVLIGPDAAGAGTTLPPGFPILRARLVQGPELAGLRGRHVVAFAGIARPDKFFAPLVQAGVSLVSQVAFPDHHAYGPRDLDLLERQAAVHDALLVTTPKDAIRLPAKLRQRVQVISVSLVWDDPDAVEGLLTRTQAMRLP